MTRLKVLRGAILLGTWVGLACSVVAGQWLLQKFTASVFGR